MAIAALAGGPAGRAQQAAAAGCQPGPDPAAMIAACTRVIESKAGTPKELASAYLNRGLAYRDKRQLDAAIADETQALTLDPNLHTAHVARALAYAIKKDFAAAIRDFDAVLQLDPHNPVVLANRGAAYIQAQQYANAVRDFDELVRLQPQSSPAYYQRGMAHRFAGEKEQAFHDFDTAVRLAPDNPLALTDLGACYLYGFGVGKDQRKATELLNKAAKLGFEPAKQLLARAAAEKK